MGGLLSPTIGPGRKIGDGVDHPPADLPEHRAGAVDPVLFQGAAGEAQEAPGLGGAQQRGGIGAPSYIVISFGERPQANAKVWRLSLGAHSHSEKGVSLP